MVSSPAAAAAAAAAARPFLGERAAFLGEGVSSAGEEEEEAAEADEETELLAPLAAAAALRLGRDGDCAGLASSPLAFLVVFLGMARRSEANLCGTAISRAKNR